MSKILLIKTILNYFSTTDDYINDIINKTDSEDVIILKCKDNSSVRVIAVIDKDQLTADEVKWILNE